MIKNSGRGYVYSHAGKTWDDDFLMEPIVSLLESHGGIDAIFEIGCGNGRTANYLSSRGYAVTGVDTSESGIAIAQAFYPHLQLAVGNGYDDLASIYGQFPCVLSKEVIEHCCYPRMLLRTLSGLLQEGGIGIVTTPYHGYWKNLALAVTGKMDAHFTVLWEGGHVKFFSMATMRALLEEFGFRNIRFIRAGRIPVFAKSMIVVFEK